MWCLIRASYDLFLFIWIELAVKPKISKNNKKKIMETKSNQTEKYQKSSQVFYMYEVHFTLIERHEMKHTYKEEDIEKVLVQHSVLFACALSLVCVCVCV